ncbi:MAG: YbdK family carboxylate-amine ligase [Acidobacteria bacterium]|nr:YbdK family carboxylate-amine ligase [Acidobacteriota bacterium]
MEKIEFRSNPTPTLGVEIELALADRRTGALVSVAPRILERISQSRAPFVKPELMQCYLEINTDICRTAGEAREDLAASLREADAVAESLGVGLYWSASHPFSLWEEQEPTQSERYLQLLELLQDVGRQLVAFGLHVHVGVDSGDKAVMICDRILRHLPWLLALSCNSPWWNARVSGLLSHRSKIMEALPTSGPPPLMRNWSEYVWLVRHLQETGFIHSIRDIWWLVRPHHNFGTVEVRVCDIPGSLEDVAALTALIHCLVCALSDEIDEGAYQHDCHPLLVRQNLWRAARFGLDAELIDAFTHEPQPVRDTVRRMIERLGAKAEELDCAAELADAERLTRGPTWAERQLALLEQTGDPAETVRRMLGGRAWAADVVR